MSQAKKLVASAVAAVGMVFASSASALVTNWTAAFDNGFLDDSSTTWGVGSITEQVANTGGIGPFAAWQQLRWGPGGPSGLNVDEGVQGGGSSVGVLTNGPTVNTVGITHLNQVIGCTRGNPGSPVGTPSATGPICLNALQQTTLLTSLTLTALDAFGPGADVVIPLPPIAIDIKFAETFNQASQGACGFAEQGEAPASAPCKDIFVVLNPEDLVQELDIDFGDGQVYAVEIGVNGLVELSDEACARAGEDPGCVGVTTPEGGDTLILANISIFTVVPEPGTLAILALGLLGIGVVTRRKRA
jgi:hypothetical protein